MGSRFFILKLKAVVDLFRTTIYVVVFNCKGFPLRRYHPDIYPGTLFRKYCPTSK
jgi:hypothetical protein